MPRIDDRVRAKARAIPFSASSSCTSPITIAPVVSMCGIDSASRRNQRGGVVDSATTVLTRFLK